MTYNEPSDPILRPERREKNGLFVILGVVAIVALAAIGYAVMQSPPDIEPAAGVESPMTPTNDNMAGNSPDTTTDAPTAPPAGTPGSTY